MPSLLVGCNVVLVARQFNPSVFSSLWLVRNGIVEEIETLPGCLYSDEVAKIETKRFSLLVIPPQLQFQPRVAPGEEGELVAATVGRIVRTLPHTPYLAAGLNFVWQVWPDDGDLSRLSRSLFLRLDGPLQEDFGTSPDALFGGYMSKDVDYCRLRLDAKPVDVQSEEAPVRRLQFAFNYQIDAPAEGVVDAIEHHLKNWDGMKGHSERIVKRVESHAKRTM